MNNKTDFICKKITPETASLSNLNKSTFFISLIFHIIISIIAIIGLPFFKKQINESPHVIVEIMPISKMDNLPTQSSDNIKKEKEVPSAKTTPDSQNNDQQKIKKEETPKDTNKANEVVIPDKKKLPKKVIEKKEIIQKPENKTKEKIEPKKILDRKKIENYESLLKTLEEPSEQKTDHKIKSTNYSKLNNQDINKPLSITTENDIKRQLYQCWSPPSGAKNAKDMAVIVRIKFAPDGTVTEANHIDTGFMQGDQFYKAAIAAAIRAVWKCSPLTIPRQEYETWKEIEFNFDPGTMIY
jgi:outer membrane biosynthesis protein TonB